MLCDITDEGGTTRSLSQITNTKVSSYTTAFSHKVNMHITEGTKSLSDY